MSADPVIQFEGVEKRFKSLVVLSNITAQIGRGEVVLVCGPSGSGKTTLLRTINRLSSIDKGRVRVEGQDVNGRAVDVNRLRKRIGFVFQQFNLFPHMTVLQNLILAPVKLLGLSKADAIARAQALLHRVGLTEKASAYPARLSGGQQQRVAIARALVMDPPILLLDEPTSALDPEMSAEVLDVLRNLARSGITLVCVSHEMGFARKVADTIWFMDRGELVERTAPERFFGQSTARARKFLVQIDPDTTAATDQLGSSAAPSDPQEAI